MPTYKEFAAKIKAKYPEYNNVDDLTLSQKMVEKYPEYKDQVIFDSVHKPEQPNFMFDGIPQPKQAVKPAIVEETAPSTVMQGGFKIPSLIQPQETIKPDPTTGFFTPEIAAGGRGEHNPNPQTTNSTPTPSFKTWAKDLGEGMLGNAQKMIGNTAELLDRLQPDNAFREMLYRTLDKEKGYLVAEEQRRASNPFQASTDELIASGKDLEEQSKDSYGNKDFIELWKEGKKAAALGNVLLEGGKSMPTSLAAFYPAGLAVIGASLFNEKYDTVSRQGLSLPESFINATGTAAFELLSEKIGSGLGKAYLKSIAKEGTEQALRTVKSLVVDFLKTQPKEILTEGIEEGANQIASTILDWATTAKVIPTTKEGWNSELKDLFKASVYGMGGGAFGGGTLSGGVTLAQLPGMIGGKYQAKKQFEQADNSLTATLSSIGVDRESVEFLKTQFIGLAPEMRNEAVSTILQSTQATPEQVEKISNYFSAMDRYAATNEKFGKQVQHERNLTKAELEAENNINQYINPDTGTLLTLNVNGVPQQIVKGKPVYREDGTIDRENSDQQYTYIDENGETQITSIEFVDNLVEDIPAPEAIQAAKEAAKAPIQAKFDNDNVRQYEVNEDVRVQTANGQFVMGTIVGMQDGFYLLDDGSGQQPAKIEPRQIMNEDNIQGLFGGEEVIANVNGQEIKGTITFEPSIRTQGLVLVNGQPVPVESIKKIGETPINEGTQAVSTDKTTETAPLQPETPQETAPTQRVWPTNKKGEVDFDSMNVQDMFDYIKETEGEQEATASLDRNEKRAISRIQEANRQLENFNKKKYEQLNKAKSIQEEGKIKASLKKEFEGLNQEVLSAQQALDEIKAIKAAQPVVEKPAPVVETKEVKPTGTLRPEIAALQEREKKTKEQSNTETNDGVFAPVIAADYLFTGGSGVMLSSEYLLTAMAGAFTRATAEIQQIRAKYLTEIDAANLGNIKDFIQSDLYKQIMSEIQAAINKSYNNNTEIQDVFNQILQYPTGFPTRIGNEVSIKLDELNSQETFDSQVETPNVDTPAETLTPQPETTPRPLNFRRVTKSVTRLNPFHRRLQNLGDYTGLEDYILRQIATGLTFKWESEGTTKGLGEELGLLKSAEEREWRKGILSDNGASPQMVAHNIWQDFSEEGNEGIIPGINQMDYSDILGVVLNVAGNVQSKMDALKQAEKLHEAWSNQDQQEWESMSEPEINYVESIPDDILEAYLGITNFTPEQLDFIDNLKNEYYDTRTEEESSINSVEGLKERPKAAEEVTPTHKITVIPNGTSAFDRQAQGFIKVAIEKALKVKTLIKFADKNKNYDVFVVFDKNYPEESNTKVLSSVEDAYDFALNSDLENLNIVRSTRNDNETTFDYFNGSLFGDYSGEMYDDKGNLKQEVKDLAISEIKNGFEINQSEQPLEMVSGNSVQPGQPNGTIADNADKTVKQPWEMTREEYRQKNITDLENWGTDKDAIHSTTSGNWYAERPNKLGATRTSKTKKVLLESIIPFERKTTIENINNGNIDWLHETSIQQALSDGKQVPAEVLKDYPELATSQPSSTEKLPETPTKQPDKEQSNVSESPKSEQKSEPSTKPSVQKHRFANGNKVYYKGKQYEINGVGKTGDGELFYTLELNGKEMFDEVPEGDVSTENVELLDGITNGEYSKEKTLQQEADEALKDFMDAFNDLQSDNLGIVDNTAEKQAKMLVAGTKMIGAFTKLGIYKFGEILKQIQAKGIQVTEELLSALKKSYGAFSAENDIEQLDEIKTVRNFTLNDLQQKKIEDLTPKQDNSKESDVSLTDQKFIKDHIIIGTIPKTPNKQPSLFEDEETTPTQNDTERGSEKTDSGLGKDQQQESTGLQPTGVDRSSTTDNGPDGGRSNGLSDIPTTEGTRNTRNNVIPRGKEYAPSSPKARFDANIEAINTVHRLIESGKQATKADQQILRQFSGWGGLGTYFNNRYSAENKTLHEALTPEEYESAVMSINSAYYTPVSINNVLWDVAEKLGFRGGNILEGSAGIGNIIGSIPRSMSSNSNIEAVEIDEISGNILKYLYPDAKVSIKGFEETNIPNGSIDLAITNVPFVTGLRIFDPIDKDLTKKFKNIHDFCIAKNIRKLKEGGIGIFISSNGTLDKSRELREWIGTDGKTDVIGAFRLNNDTFGGTTVTSDIIIVRKRVANQKHPKAIDVVKSSFVRAGEYDTKETDYDKKTRSWVPVMKKTTMEYNDYFKEHPENMGGEMAFAYEKGDTFRPGGVGLYPGTVNQAKQLKQWIDSFDKVESGSEAKKEVSSEGTTAKEGQLIINSKGKLSLSYRGTAKELDINDNKVKGETKAQCLKDYNKIKETLQAVLDYQVANESNDGLKPLLNAFNRAYDNFVAKYGQLNKNTTISFLRNDVDFPSIVSIEKYSETKSIEGLVTKNISKTEVFKDRVVSVKTELKPTNTKDAVIASIYKYGAVNVPYIAENLNKTEQEVKDEIIGSKLGFKDPATGSVVVRHEYLSGDVRSKLKLAQASNDKSEYTNNIEELTKVIPMDIPAHLIEFTMGTSWLDKQLYVDYFKDKFNVDVEVQHHEGRWTVNPRNRTNETNRAAGVYSESLGITVYGSDLATAAMNLKPITVSQQRKDYTTGKTETVTDKDATQAANTRVSEIRDDFKEFVRGKLTENKEQADKMAQEYNDRANSYVPMEIDETYLPERFEGASKTIKLHSHQKKATIRGTMEPLMLAHEVGAGKTFVLISTAMEMRRLGTANKPMIVVQNATVGQFVTSAKTLYPNAKILTITDNDRTPEGRRMFYAKIKYSDWDMIVVPQSTFEMIPDSPESQQRFIEEKIDEKLHTLEAMREENDDSNKWTIMAMEKEIEALRGEQGTLSAEIAAAGNNKEAKKIAKTVNNAAVKAKEQLDRRTDDVQYFDQMGIDALLVDEAHEYKRLGFATGMTRGVKGIDPAGSKKAAGVYLKTRIVLEKSDWKNVVFATGTPISNTAAEIWTFMKYMIPKEVLMQNEIYYFDDFVRNFGSINQSLEFATNGSFKENTRFSSYINKPELIRLWATVTDTVLSKDIDAVNEKIPLIEGDKATDIFLPQTPSLIDIMRAIKARLKQFENMTGKEKRKNSSIPIVMYGMAKRAAIDVRLVSNIAEDEPNSKTNKAVDETVRALKDSNKYKGTVAIFCDSQNRWDKDAAGKKVKGFDLFEDIKEKLIKQGVAESEIMIIKPGMTVGKKEKIFDAVNVGDIRVVLGNTKTLGTGVNMQERLYTIIHMDAPDRPMDYTQRNGRILRQGNLHKEWGIPVRILRFGVEDSLDVTSYQRLKTKSGFIDSIMDGKAALLDPNNPEGRILEEDEEGLFDNPVAVLSGSQYALLKNQAERELRKWESKKKQHEADQIYIQHQLKSNEQYYGWKREHLKDLEKAKSIIDVKFANGVNTLTISGKKITGVENYIEDEKVRAKVNEYIKPIAKAINEKTDKARENAYFTKENVPTKILFNGVEAIIITEIERESVWDDKVKMNRIVMHKTNRVNIPELGIDVRLGAGSLMQAIEDIYKSLDKDKINGRVIIVKSDVRQLESDNAAMEGRRGKPFAHGEELQSARRKVIELTELMKQELAAKEEKYKNAGNGANVDLESIDTEEEVAEEQDDSSIREPQADYLNLNNNSENSLYLQEPNIINNEDPNYKEYKTQTGEVIPYIREQLSMFPVDATNGDIQQEGNKAEPKYDSYFDSDPNTEDLTHFERLMSEQKHIKLSGDTRLKSAQDVAYLFRSLESSPVENVFVAMISKSGNYKVLFLSTGATNQSTVDIKLIAAAAKEFEAASVTLVHNHPSGTLRTSNEDKAILKRMRYALDGISLVNPGIIINLDSGKFLEFDENTEDVIPTKSSTRKENEYTPKVYAFDKQRLYTNSSNLDIVRSSMDIAVALSKFKRGTADKYVVMILNGKNAIVRTFLTNDISAKTLLPMVGKHGERVVISGNVKLEEKTLSIINLQLKQAGSQILDYLCLGQDPTIVAAYTSYSDEGILYQPTPEYTDDSVHEPATNVNQIAQVAGEVLTEKMRDELDKKIGIGTSKLNSFVWKEAYQDQHLAVKEFLDVLRKNGQEIKDYNDFYLRVTALGGMNDAQLQAYELRFNIPIMKAVNSMEKKATYREIENYMMLKHGLERNEYMRNREAIAVADKKVPVPSKEEQQNDIDGSIMDEYKIAHEAYVEYMLGKLADKDYAAQKVIEKEVGLTAEEYIRNFEAHIGVDEINEFWKQINAATQNALKTQLKNGMISKAIYDELLARYKNYIPLRGFDQEIAEDKYDYTPDMGTHFVAPLIKANGRVTRPEMPFAFIFSMNQSAIVQSNKNNLKQSILRLAREDKSNIMKVSKAWYEKIGEDEDGKPIWESRSPMYDADYVQYNKNIEDFEEQMKVLAEQGLATQKKGKLDIGLFVKPKQAKQHEVHVYENGVEYVVYINANPKVARAINGDNVVEPDKALEVVANVNRWMAANFTVRNPLFVISNLERDLIYSTTTLGVKEGFKYQRQFAKNIPAASLSLARLLSGKADPNNKYDAYAIEFIMNGGKTGYSHIVEIKTIQKRIEKEIKKGKINEPGWVFKAFESANTIAENTSRLSTYITSREMGRSVIESISNAKEVTVNFNRKGSGALGSTEMRSFYLFFNVAVQALSNLSKLIKQNKGKMIGLLGSFVASGFLAPMLAGLMGGDDAEEAYSNLTEWERQNNFCMWTGNGFAKFALPQELRVFHALGDNIYMCSKGRLSLTELAVNTIVGITDLLPVNPIGGIKNEDKAWKMAANAVIPDALKPFGQLWLNVTFTGGSVYNDFANDADPGFQQASKNKLGQPYAPAILVWASQKANELTGGDNVVPGKVSPNPDIVNHLMRGYLGGLYTIAIKSIDTVDKVVEGKDLKMRDTPLSQFYTSVEDIKESNAGLRKEYNDVKYEIKDSKRYISRYQQEAEKMAKEGKDVMTIAEYQRKAMDLRKEKYFALEFRIRLIDRLEKDLDEVIPDKIDEYQAMINERKKEVIAISKADDKDVLKVIEEFNK